MSPELTDLFKEPNRRTFEELEREYRSGKKEALIQAISVCALMDVGLPTWVREAVIAACFNSTQRSWDDVFGRPHAKGKSVTAERRRSSIAMGVIGRTRELHSSGEPIGLALFEKVGEEFGVSGGTVSNIYYDKQAVDRFEIRKLQAELKALGPDADEDTVADWLRQNIYRLPKPNKAKF